VVFDRHSDAVLFGLLDGFPEHSSQALDLSTVWLVAEPQTATYNAHDACTETSRGFETTDHLGISVFVRAALQGFPTGERLGF
jgi:hypothetical protein